MQDNPLPTPLSEALRHRLETFRLMVLRLHKVLLEDERQVYEKSHGPASATEILGLLMTDPWFDWLRELSKIVVEIDELLEDEKASDARGFASLEKGRTLFRPGETETDFLKRYKQVLQRNSEAVMNHAEVMRALFSDH